MSHNTTNPHALAILLGPGVRGQMFREGDRLSDGRVMPFDWFRFIRGDKLIGAGETWRAAYVDAKWALAEEMTAGMDN